MMRTMKIAKAAFSKSVIWISMGRNSTRQPVSLSGGGGLKRMCCQFVDWRFSKWSVLVRSSSLRSSAKMTRGSRMKRWAKWVASRSSIPPSMRRCFKS